MIKKNTFLLVFVLWHCLAAYAQFPPGPTGHLSATLMGRVTCDGRPLGGVAVSDGVQIVETDAEGRYVIASDKALGTVFVITPGGYVAVSKDGVQPAFYANLTAEAEVPESHDFNLRSEDQSRYEVIFAADIHLANDVALDDQARFPVHCMPLVRRVAEELGAEGPVYSFNLGDLAFDKYWVKDSYTLEDAYATLVREGWPVPLYSVPGNHDNDGRVSTDNTDFDAGWLYRKVLGPEHYSLDIGDDHWIVMDDIIYRNTPGKPAKRAEGMAGIRDFGKGFTETEMAFLRRDLARQPNGKRIFLCTHCPILTCLADGDARFDDAAQMRELDSLFARFGTVRVFAGHTHQMEWRTSAAYPHILATNVAGLSGNAWSTQPGIYCKFGGNAGVLVARFAPGKEDYRYDSVVRKDDCFRVYDMNAVADYYRTEPVIRDLVARIPNTVDYAAGYYRNMLYINDWFLRPGETLELWEQRGLFGRKVSLPVEAVAERDPMFDLHFFLRDGAVKENYNKARTKDRNYHLFAVRASGPRTKLIIRVRDASGAIVRESVIRRPLPFRPFGES